LADNIGRSLNRLCTGGTQTKSTFAKWGFHQGPVMCKYDNAEDSAKHQLNYSLLKDLLEYNNNGKERVDSVRITYRDTTTSHHQKISKICIDIRTRCLNQQFEKVAK